MSKVSILTLNSGSSASLERRGDDLLFIWVGNLSMETTKPVSLLKNNEALEFGGAIPVFHKIL